MPNSNKRLAARESGEIISAQKVADMLGISKQSVIRRANEGEIPGKKLGHIWLFRAETVASLVP